MDKNHSQINAIHFARAGLISSGALGIILTAMILLPTFGGYVVHTAFYFERGILAPLMASALAPIITICICGYVVTKADLIARRLFPDLNPTCFQIERAIYRVAFTSIGLVILAFTLPSFVHAIGNAFITSSESSNWPVAIVEQFALVNLPDIVAFVFQFWLATYLLIGAPALIRWQISRVPYADERS